MGNNSTNQSSTVQQEGTKLNPGDEGAPGTPEWPRTCAASARGQGKLGDVECPTCKGTGKVYEELGGG